MVAYEERGEREKRGGEVRLKRGGEGRSLGRGEKKREEKKEEKEEKEAKEEEDEDEDQDGWRNESVCRAEQSRVEQNKMQQASR